MSFHSVVFIYLFQCKCTTVLLFIIPVHIVQRLDGQVALRVSNAYNSSPFFDSYLVTFQWAHDVYTSSPQRRCNVLTLRRRYVNAIYPPPSPHWGAILSAPDKVARRLLSSRRFSPITSSIQTGSPSISRTFSTVDNLYQARNVPVCDYSAWHKIDWLLRYEKIHKMHNCSLCPIARRFIDLTCNRNPHIYQSFTFFSLSYLQKKKKCIRNRKHRKSLTWNHSNELL